MFLFRPKRDSDLPAKRNEQEYLPLIYSWILNNQLAIGPMPRVEEHWSYLESLGFHSRFSCCYQHEEAFAPPPSNWTSISMGLPDHRQQEILTIKKLESALSAAENLIYTSNGPVYLHCFAGQERSSLLAIGLTSILREMDLFTALEWVRRCHPNARPIYQHLDILDTLLSARNR